MNNYFYSISILIISIVVQSTLNTDSGFVSGSPGTITIGADTCAPSSGESLRIRCQTTPTIPVSWTLDGNSVAGSEFINVSGAGTYTCAGTDSCGNALNSSSNIIRMY